MDVMKQPYHQVGFEVLTAMSVKSTFFWDVTQWFQSTMLPPFRVKE
jgi:hypothetical protein